MPVFYDPYTALQFRKQRQAAGGPALNPNELEALGYGVTSAQSEKALASRGIALQEKSQAAQEAQFGQSLSSQQSQFAQSLAQRQSEFGTTAGLTAEQIAQQKRAATMGLVFQAPTALGTVEWLTKGKDTPGWIGQAGQAIKGAFTPSTTTTQPAISSYNPTDIPAEGAVGTEGTAFYGGAPTNMYASAGGMTATDAGGAAALASEDFGMASEGVGMTGGELAGGTALGYAAAPVAAYGAYEFGKKEGMAGGVIGGATMGAMAGTAVAPGIGTIVGTILGAGIGAIGGSKH